MPYEIKPEPGGYVVINSNTGMTYSNRPLTLEMAKKQMKAMYASEKTQKPLKQLVSKRSKVSGRAKMYSPNAQQLEDDVMRKLAKFKY